MADIHISPVTDDFIYDLIRLSITQYEFVSCNRVGELQKPESTSCSFLFCSDLQRNEVVLTTFSRHYVEHVHYIPETW